MNFKIDNAKKVLTVIFEALKKLTSILFFIIAVYGFTLITIGFASFPLVLLKIAKLEFYALIKVTAIGLISGAASFLIGSLLWEWTRRWMLLGVILVIVGTVHIVGLLGSLMMVGFDPYQSISNPYFGSAVNSLIAAPISLIIGIFLVVKHKKIG